MPSVPSHDQGELPADNGARLAIFDAMVAPSEAGRPPRSLSDEELAARVVSRLRVLVPQELHLAGEERYIALKIGACTEAGILRRTEDGRLARGEVTPRVRYPDGILRDYTPGLEAARERLDRDESRLRQAGFNVRNIMKPASRRNRADSFRQLVSSMQEHGFVDQFPLVETSTGEILDGLARMKAAEEAGVDVSPKRHIVRLKRRDSPLHNTLLFLDLNAGRLTSEDVELVHDAVAEAARRPWSAIDADLALTRQWRRTVPKAYDVKFDVDLHAYAGQDEAKVQVTTDRTKVMLRSLMVEAGLREYQRDLLKPYVPMEEARTQHTGKKAYFVDIDVAIAGIRKMIRARDRDGLKTDPGWSAIASWLEDTFRPQQDEHS